jgi:hypothetical protein
VGLMNQAPTNSSLISYGGLDESSPYKFVINLIW